MTLKQELNRRISELEKLKDSIDNCSLSQEPIFSAVESILSEVKFQDDP